MKSIVVLFLTLTVLFDYASFISVPNYIKTCRVDSPDFKKCAIQSGNEAIPHLVKGDKSLGLPSFMPFKISFLSISSRGFEMNLTDASFSGVEDLDLIDYTFDPVKKFCSMTLTGPLLTFEFDYSTGGKIASLPIEGNGHGWAKFYNGNYSYSYNFDTTTRKGKHYMNIGKDKVTIEPEKMQSELGNLFNGNKQLGDNLNNFLNENWRDLLKEFDPVITEVYGSIAKGILKKIYGRIPLEELFPGVVFLYCLSLAMMKAFLICVFFVGVSVHGLSLPKYIKTCSLNSPDFKECAIKHGNEAISHLVEGDRSYGIPSFKPFKIPHLMISSNGLEMNLTDASFSGADKFKIQDYIFDPVKKFSSTTLKGPVITFEFDFSTKGRIGPLAIEGNGHGWAKFSRYMKACRANDPELNKCALRNGNAAIPHIVKGDRKYRIPRMTPLEIPSVTVSGGKNLNVKMDNLKIYGLEKAKLVDIDLNLPRKTIKLVLKAETITVIGNYDIDAKILILPIKGKGPANITLYNPVMTYAQEFELEVRRGDYYGYIKNSELHYDIDRVFYHFGNLFDGNEQLGLETNRLLNENWPIVHNDLSRPVGETILEVINSIIENVYDLIPYRSMILFD
ncbi:uncharacterized protein LOC123318379 [Coccinella septempunctata]|uniref:uncharacterized protein LOC123318379 n=1 Tax=Coccinella septempunctata TaxID=41139 RepID=UPI001D06C3D7|nr:uncharacterized protein LOC123318379 [Coccinella septempunctata]